MTQRPRLFQIFCIASCILAAGICMAQQPIYEPPRGKQEPEDRAVEQTRPEQTRSRRAQSFADDVLSDPRNRAGLLLGLYEGYTSNIIGIAQQRQPSAITAFSPRVFVNLGKRKSQFHLDVGGGYRIYNSHREYDGYDYYGGANYRYQYSKRTSFYVSDYGRSSINDSGSFLSPMFISVDSTAGPSHEFIYSRRRITRNSLTAGLDQAVGRRGHFSIFSGYQAYKYQQSDIGNVNAILLGATFDYRLTKWLFLSNSYQTYLNNVDDRFRDTRIHRLQAGGLDFRLGRHWRLSAGAGVEIAQYGEESRVRESVSATLSCASRNAAFNLVYHRGFSSGIGLPATLPYEGFSRILMSDSITSNLGYRMTRWMNGKLSSYYYRSSEISRSGLLETFWGEGGLEFALRPDLIASANYGYQNQRVSNISADYLGVNRYIAYVGLQYLWPGIRP